MTLIFLVLKLLRIAAQGNIERFIFPVFQVYAYVDCRFASYVGLNLSLFTFSSAQNETKSRLNGLFVLRLRSLGKTSVS